MSIFSSSNTFRQEAPDEKTILITRKHRINLIAPLYLTLILSILPLIIYFLVNSSSWYRAIAPLYSFLVAVIFLFLWNMVFYFLTIYYLNTLIVTDKRIVEYEQKGFFDYAVNEMELEKVQDITVRRKGSLSYFLNFGEIEIQTAGAGAEKEIHITQLPDPDKIKEIIMDQVMKY